ncbi:MAG: Smr/MutS family protein [Flavobacteriales bacterium]
MLKIGDKVSFVHTALKGEIISLQPGRAIVEDEYGFEHNVAIRELVPFAGIDAYKLSDRFMDKERPTQTKKKKSKVLSYGKLIDKQVMEIDLHIEELTDSHIGLSNTEIIQLQLKIFRKAINEAIEMRLRKLIVIHGVGLGVLREEIRRELADYPGYEYHDADFRKYGQGATEIIMRRLYT